MASEVDICNLALAYVGAKRISSLSDSQPEATHCNLLYSICRDAVLEDHDWSFARVRAALAEASDVEVDDWEYVYTYPTDCLAPRKIYPGTVLSTASDPIEFEVGLEEGDLTHRYICTNEESATLIYTAKVTTTTMFSNNFITALAWRLAAELAVVLRGKPDLRNSLTVQYEMALAKAKALNSNEEQRQVDEVNTFKNARL